MYSDLHNTASLETLDRIHLYVCPTRKVSHSRLSSFLNFWKAALCSVERPQSAAGSVQLHYKALAKENTNPSKVRQLVRQLFPRQAVHETIHGAKARKVKLRSESLTLGRKGRASPPPIEFAIPLDRPRAFYTKSMRLNSSKC